MIFRSLFWISLIGIAIEYSASCSIAEENNNSLWDQSVRVDDVLEQLTLIPKVEQNPLTGEKDFLVSAWSGGSRSPGDATIQASVSVSVEVNGVEVYREGPSKPQTDRNLKKIPPGRRVELQRQMSRASVYHRSGQILQVLDALLEAERIADEYGARIYQINALRGAALSKVRDFESAQKEFELALEIDPEGSLTVGRNLADVLFIQAKWKAALSRYSILVGGDDEVVDRSMNKATEREIRLKSLICKLKLGQFSEATSVMRKLNYLDEVPDFYLGNAAIEFSRDNPKEAKMWIGSAKRIYGDSAVKAALQTFVDAEWIDYPGSVEEQFAL